MRRYGLLIGLGLLACSVEVDGGSAGLSAGAGSGKGPGGGGAHGDADDGSSGSGSPAPPGDETSTGALWGVDESSGEAGGGAETTSSPDTEDGADVDATEDGAGTSTGGGSTSMSDTTTGDDGAPGDPLDPDLDVPDDGKACLTPGNLGQCPAVEVCRFHTTEQGRCETCEGCGNLGAPCVTGLDCDIVFACYLGRCTNFCELGTFNCGPIEDCIDVGHPTHGVCTPL